MNLLAHSVAGQTIHLGLHFLLQFVLQFWKKPKTRLEVQQVTMLRQHTSRVINYDPALVLFSVLFIYLFIYLGGEGGGCGGDGKYNYGESDGRFGLRLHKTCALEGLIRILPLDASGSG